MTRRALLLSTALIAAHIALGAVMQPVDAATTASTPTRVLDTRTGLGMTQGRLAPGAVGRLRIPSVQPSGETAVMLNLTAVDATGPGHVSAWSCDDPEPDTSIVNFGPGQAVPNMVVLRYGSSGLCFSTVSPVHLVADLTATTTDGDYRGVTPQRLVDTRAGGPYLPGREYRVQVGGTSGVPSSAAAAAVNVTVVAPPDDGWVRVGPCGAATDASTANFRAGEVVAHFTFTALSSGAMCVLTSVLADVVIDSFGWMAADSELVMLPPGRLLDTRTGLGGTLGSVGDGELVRVRVAGRAGVPNGAPGATVNIVAVDGAAPGHVTAWPCDVAQPNTSTLNLWPGVLRANQATLRLSESGEICLRPTVVGRSRLHLVVDAVGHVKGDPVDRPPPPSTSVPGGRFGTLAPGAALPSGSQCAARVRPAPEIRPANTTSNNNRGGPQYANNDPAYNGWFHRVDGDFAGTTDEIIQWAACKWGIDEDLVRAQIIKESWWNQHNPPGDNGESWGLGQVRRPYHSWAFEHDQVNAINSSAYNLDYTYAVWRGCFEGLYTWLNQTNERNGTYTAGDAWGCMGVWYSGRWYHNTDDYLNAPGDSVRWHYDNRTWLTPDFINSN